MFGDLGAVDRKIAYVTGVLGLILLVGLVATGVWQFLFHEPEQTWARYVVGSHDFRLPRTSQGAAEIHGTFGDLAALLALWATAWYSSRVLFGVSWFGVGTLVLGVATLVTGGVIRFNAVFRNGRFDADARGYGRLFTDGFDVVVTDRYELGETAMRFWTIVHVISIPALLAAGGLALRQRRARARSLDEPQASWLDRLGPPTR